MGGESGAGCMRVADLLAESCNDGCSGLAPWQQGLRSQPAPTLLLTAPHLPCLPHHAAGENVILIANHQSEADPAVFALLLEKTFPKLAQGACAWVAMLLGGWVVLVSLCACSVCSTAIPKLCGNRTLLAGLHVPRAACSTPVLTLP